MNDEQNVEQDLSKKFTVVYSFRNGAVEFYRVAAMWLLLVVAISLLGVQLYRTFGTQDSAAIRYVLPQGAETYRMELSGVPRGCMDLPSAPRGCVAEACRVRILATPPGYEQLAWVELETFPNSVLLVSRSALVEVR